jgi:DnaJ like chaperone protein
MGKVIGGTIGLFIGGPLGAIAGAALGHGFDLDGKSGTSWRTSENYRPRGNEQYQFTFFVAVFSMLAKIARADGTVHQAEINAVNNFIDKELNLDPQGKTTAMNIFNQALASPESFDSFAVQFSGYFHSRPQIIEMMIDIFLRIALADGKLSAAEEDMIGRAVKIFGMTEEKYSYIRSRYVKSTASHYSILGLNSGAGNEEIKKAYRKMAADFHPDKISSKGLPEEFTKFAEEKFRSIQEAYEAIKKERGFN